ncbi:hypothetical protein, partial [Daejeonella sp. H1SJ63]|uniref:hypothetical protein n=1 Tax=Daejeonella sp. H1SJ63 TaxID=3034145 RepID=UPI0023EBA59B
DAVTTAKILDANVTTAKIASGGNDKVLTTDGTGVVSWLDKSTFAVADATTLATGKIQLAGDLSGTATSPAIAANAVTTAKIADANITAAKLAADAVTTAKILDANVTTAKIASGGNDKVLTTDGTGVVSWLDKSTFAVADATTLATGKIQLAGDLSGTATSPAITNAAVINKTLTGYTAGSGTVAATDNILQAIQKVDGNVALKAPLASPTFTGTVTLPTGTVAVTQAANNNSTAVATTAYVDAAAGTPDADATTKGKIQLAGDLVGTAASPAIAAGAVTTAKLADANVTLGKLENIATASLLGRSTAGSGAPEVLTATAAKTLLSLSKTDVGLANVDNTSDANKPVSGATQTALDLKAPLASPALTGVPTAPTATNGTNTTQVATTAFVTTAVTGAAAADATTLATGKIQLAGDLAGTATSPAIAANAVTTAKIADANITAAKLAVDAVTTAKILDANVTTAKIASGGNDKVLTTDGTGIVSWLDKSTFAVADATTLATGKIQLAGDLAGTATSPTITNAAVINKTLTGYTAGAGTV